MTDPEDLLARLARAIAATPIGNSLSSRLCHACQELTGADVAITVGYTSSHRVTLCATNELSSRLEDLQDVVGEGPGHTAAQTGEIQVCPFPPTSQERWSMFVEAAEDVVRMGTITAVPMRPGEQVFGVITFYQIDPAKNLLLDERELLALAAAVGAALMRDPTAFDDEVVQGPWSARAQIHQATGMVIAQLGVDAEDALALLRAHAYAGQTTLSAIAAAVVERKLSFTNQ